jgi:shikimate dehydrogenase
VRLAVLGDPVAHSLSPLLHGAALRELGLPGTYEAIRVDADGMRSAVDDLRRGLLDGVNVTMPHKALAAELADLTSADVARMGAANTLVRIGDAVAAHTTDIAGVRHAWSDLPDDAPVLILGGGGAAAAALLAVAGRQVGVATRTPTAAKRLIDRLGVDAEPVPWGAAVAGAVVVNATPIGMHGEELPAGVLAAACGLLDMAYGSAATPAVRTVGAQGKPVADGRAMLLGQAAASFRLWTGRPAPLAAMRRALAAAPEAPA